MTKEIVQLNYLKITPRKVRSVADLVRGLSVNEAEAQLMLVRNRAAVPLRKLLRSAVQNLKNNRKLDPANFYIEAITVDVGPMLKRFLPRARGMATPIQKKMSHVTMTLGENPNLKPPRFKIAIEKKEKLPKKEREGKPTKEKRVADQKIGERKKPGFFRKIFSRKSI